MPGSKSLVHFTVTAAVAKAVGVETIKAHGREAGVSNSRFRYKISQRTTRDGNLVLCRITCSPEMAAFLIDKLRVAADEAERAGNMSLGHDCSQAVGDVIARLMRATSGGLRQPG